MNYMVQNFFGATCVPCLLAFGYNSLDDYTTATFDGEGGKATMMGDIDSQLPNRVRELHKNHPEVTTKVMQKVPGSIDGEANLTAA